MKAICQQSLTRTVSSQTPQESLLALQPSLQKWNVLFKQCTRSICWSHQVAADMKHLEEKWDASLKVRYALSFVFGLTGGNFRTLDRAQKLRQMNGLAAASVHVTFLYTFFFFFLWYQCHDSSQSVSQCFQSAWNLSKDNHKSVSMASQTGSC